MKKGMGSMMVLGSYLTTIRNSVTVIVATSHACCPSFLWNFLVKKMEKPVIMEKEYRYACDAGNTQIYVTVNKALKVSVNNDDYIRICQKR